MQAHIAVESLTLDREVSHLKQQWGLKFAELTYNGFWFAPETMLLKNAIDASKPNLKGWTKLKI